MELQGDDFLSEEQREINNPNDSEVESEDDGENSLDDEMEISFHERSSRGRSIAQLEDSDNENQSSHPSTSTEAMKGMTDEDITPEEEQSMLKFAKFLERSGFICKDDSPKTTEGKKQASDNRRKETGIRKQ